MGHSPQVSSVHSSHQDTIGPYFYYCCMFFQSALLGLVLLVRQGIPLVVRMLSPSSLLLNFCLLVFYLSLQLHPLFFRGLCLQYD